MADAPHEFSPDWTIAPAETLREWMGEHGITRARMGARFGQGDLALGLRAHLLLHDVLERRPLLEQHAEILERGTGIPARAWLNLERQYREDLAAGRKDMTSVPEEASRG